ncbi:MAG: putative lipid II flippase FtsW [Clostridia bacterium]|nr:putative lipid II flippase FtsW [Clostridia bacterium]
MLKSLLLFDKKRGDAFIPLTVILLAVFGLFMVYSASYYTAETTLNDKYFYLKKQLIGFLFGLTGMLFFSFFNYKKLLKIKTPLLIISIILLALVFTPLGVENYGAKRWIGVGSITIQPSEIAKFAFIIFTAGYFYKNVNRTQTFKGILPVILVGLTLCLLIMLEPNMSITVCLGALFLTMLYSSGVKLKYVIIILLPLIALVPILILVEPYRLKRLLAFINPWESPKGEGYQLIQSLYALGRGGFTGVGYLNSVQKYRFLPFAESDFILSVIGEEFGLIGVITMFLVDIFLIWRGFKTAIRCKNYFGYLLAIGITFIYAVQVGVNALVVTGSIPPTGLPLPLISAGNTSLIVFMSAFGILHSISKDCDAI